MAALGSDRILFTNSITPMPQKVAATVRPMRREHLAKTMEIEVPLQMRGYPKLLEKLGHGALVSPAEMERDYLPRASDYKELVKWLRHEGFTITQTDPSRLTLFARGSLAQIQQSFQVEMVQVSVDGIDYHAARTHPSLPRSIAQPVLGINGLQPFLHLHKKSLQPSPNISGQPPYVVKEILGAYSALNLGVTGSNQKIAILIDTVPSHSDLTSFWSFNNIPQKLSNIEEVNVTGVALPAPSGEETLDVEWSSGIAPAAKVRVYASGSLSFTDVDKSLQRIISDLPSQPQMHQLSISLGLGESYLLSSSQMQTDAQFFASIASSGVSVFVSSGDAGSNPDSSGQGSTGPLQVEYFASDPSVTGVGGTNLTLDVATGAVSGETGWNGSGGGVSQQFSRPTWQAGTGVIAGTKRLVPDVSLVASDTTDAYFYFGGKGSGVAGTSWSSPTWAGFCALINEARANATQGPLGLLNPHIYPLIGTSNFRDITSGNNGHYSAGAGYDMVTGLGVPSVAALIQSLAGLSSGAPFISGFTPSSGAINTNVTITGANLGRATAIAFNGVNATTFSVDSSTQITATVPIGASTGPLTVTATPGGSASTVDNFTVLTGAVANDNFASAQVLGTTGTLTATNVGATKETGEPNHAGNVGGASVWYDWTAPKAGTFTFDTFGSSFDTLLAIYTGDSVSGLSQIAANDDAGTGVTSSLSFVATAGSLYHIAVDGHGGQTGTLTLHWILNSAAPVINSFAPATASPGTVIAISGANFTGATSVTLSGSSAPFSVVSPTQITATVPDGATTGVITVSSPNGTATSAAVLTVTTPPANDNFDKALVISGSSGVVTGVSTGATKEPGEPEHAGNAGGSSVWYSWTAPSSDTYSFNTFGSSFDTLLAVYTGSSVGTLTPVASADDTGGGVTSSVSFNAVAGAVYAIAMDGNGGAAGNLALSWSWNDSPPLLISYNPASGPVGAPIVLIGSHFTGATSVTFNGLAANFVINSDTQITATVPPGATNGVIIVANLNGTGVGSDSFTVTNTPLNDNFSNRATLSGSGGTVAGSNVGATKETGEPNHAGNSGGSSVWWQWTAPATGHYVISTLGSNFDTLLGVYTGSSVSSLAAVASNDDDPNGGVTSSLVLSATAGSTYQVAVDGLNGASGKLILTVAPSGDTSALFSTGFEASEGYSTTAVLGGQPSSSGTADQWQLLGSNGNGVLSGFFPGQGQQAYLGNSRVNSDSTFVWKPVNFIPKSNDTVTFSVSMAIVDSTNRRYDDFQWQVYNTSGQMLFAVDFDNSSLAIGYFLADKSYHDTGASFANSTQYTLQVALNFGQGTWSASLNGKSLISGQPLNNSTPMALDFGDADAVWGGSPSNNYHVLGNNYLVFDNYSITTSSLVAPKIVLEPQSQTAKVGNSATLSVAALGSQPLSYQWLKNGTNLKGATAANLTLAGVQASDAASYNVSVSNAAGAILSSTANLTVVTPPPSYAVTTSSSPNNEGTTSGDGVYETGTSVVVIATPNSGNSFVNWTENGTVVSTSPSYQFAITAKRSLVAHFQPAQYTISTSASPSSSGTTRGSGIYPNATQLLVSAIPASGFEFVNWSESGSVVSVAAKYSFSVIANRDLVANFAPDTTPPAISIKLPTANPTFTTANGTFSLSGTASDNESVTKVTWSNQQGGNGTATGTTSWSASGISLQPGANLLTITAFDPAGNFSSANLQVKYQPPVNFKSIAGSYTGLLETTGSTYAFGSPGAFTGLAKITVNSSGSFSASIWFESLSSTLHGKFDNNGDFSGYLSRVSHSPLSVTLRADSIQLDALTGTISDGTVATQFTANRSVFNSKTNRCPYAGHYTVVLKNNPASSGAPQGQGIGTLKVDTSGQLRFSGILADGSRVSQGTTISKNGLWPFYASLYSHSGFIAGPQSFETLDSTDIDGVLDWFKPFRLKDSYFPSGIQTRLSVLGNTFNAPLKGHTVIKLGSRSATLLDSDVNFSESVELNPLNQLTIQSPGANRLQLKISASSGLISGKFLAHPPLGTWTSLWGVILQRQDRASGFFLESSQSGELELTPAP